MAVLSYVVIASARRRGQTNEQLHQRADHRSAVRAHRAGLHDGLRHHRADQLRPWRNLHDRHLRPLIASTHWASPVRSMTRCSSRRAGPRLPHHDGRRWPRWRRHRALRLSAAAQCPPPCAPDHGHRRQLHPSEHCRSWGYSNSVVRFTRADPVRRPTSALSINLINFFVIVLAGPHDRAALFIGAPGLAGMRSDRRWTARQRS